MSDATSLDRFHQAQAAASGGFEDARRELRAGRKTSHWIWYVLPQLARPGTSRMSQTYAIADRAEAMAYLRDPVLGPRLAELTGIVARHLAAGVELTRLMGGTTDALKIVSCLTLFEAASAAMEADSRAEARPVAFALADLRRDCETVLMHAEQQGFPRCAFTLECLARG